MTRLTIRTRLTLTYVAVLALVLVSFSAGVLWLQGRFGHAQLDDELSALSATVTTALVAELQKGHAPAAVAAEMRQDFDIPNRTVAILDPANGRTVGAHWRGLRRVTVPSIEPRRSYTATVLQDGMPWRLRVERLHGTNAPFAVVVAASESPLAHERHLLIKAFLVGTPIALLGAALVCWIVASSALRPLTRMSEEAERITVDSLDTRLSAATADDEIDHLRRSFNRLLDRVASGVAVQRQFVADASHELRTPVSAARAAAEVTLAAPHRREAEYRNALGIVGAQTRRLGRMVDDMLVLARADAGGFRLRPRRFSLDELLEDAAASVRLIARRKGIALRTAIDASVFMHGDDQLVRQMTLNLLDNAIKHTPRNGRITVSLRAPARHAEIVVEDSGGGIPSEHRERIFERFVRLDDARGACGGAGLGLPIARWIATLHSGTLVLDGSGSRGSRFVAKLPLA